MKKVIIIPYFGKLPNYFQLFLNSCNGNNKIDFKIFTDDQIDIYKVNNNIQFIKMSFNELQELAIKKLKVDYKIQSPYKLCDYKPAYGIIFQDYIKEYDFWGYCDVDLIFGNIEKFLPDEIFNKYEKIQVDGHLTFFKNIDEVNNLIFKESNKIINFKEVIKIKEPCFFDEIQLRTLVKEYGIKEYVCYQYADILPNYFDFNIQTNDNLNNYPGQVFYYDNGRVFRKYMLNGEEKTDEFMYIHLQKRKMKVYINNECKMYYINANNFNTCINEDKVNKKIYHIKYVLQVIKKFNLTRLKIKKNVIKQKKAFV